MQSAVMIFILQASTQEDRPAQATTARLHSTHKKINNEQGTSFSS